MTAQTPPPRRRVPVLVWVGAALLVVSLIGASKALPSGDTSPGDDAPQGSPDRVPAFGHLDVPGRPTPLHPLQLGKIHKLRTFEDGQLEGHPVEAGTELLWMDDTVQKAQVEMAKAAVEDAELQVRQAKMLKAQHASQRSAQARAVEAKKGEQKAAEAKAKLARRMADSKNLPPEDADAAEGLAAAAAQAVKAEEDKLAALDALDPDVAVARAEADLKGKQAQLRKAQYALDECVVRAPARGEVLRCNVSEGETLGPNPPQPALIFCPKGKRVVRTEVEQEFAPYVFIGQKAVIEDDTRTSPKYHGKVTHISNWFAHRRSMLLEPLQFNDVRTLECLVEVDEKAPFRIGQRLRVTLQPAE
jgi:multidrug efflux pump subunit AcrA (membrane-fusion protein)